VVPAQFDKIALAHKIFNGDYDFSFRFSLKINAFQVVNIDSKARSMSFNEDTAFVSFHNNNIKSYLLKEEGKPKSVIDLEYHKQAIRNI